MPVRVKADLRLRKDRQIRFVLEHGKVFRGQHFLLRIFEAGKIIPAPEGKGPFLAVVISRKREKKAAARNRTKRRLREIFRKNAEFISPGTACVVVAKQIDKRTDFHELENDFLKLIEQSKKQKQETKRTAS